MASSSMQFRPAIDSRETQTDDTEYAEDILQALEDTDCRRVLEATATKSLTAKELADHCEVPKSTLYRKLDMLTSTGLLDEHIRLSKNGKHARQFKRAFEDVTISAAPEGQFTVKVS